MTSSEVINALKADGWFLDRVRGSHHIFKHAVKGGHVTVPHPKEHIKMGTLKSIERQSGISLIRH